MAEAMAYCECRSSFSPPSAAASADACWTGSALLTFVRPNRNPGGIRFGSAEIYQVLETSFAAESREPEMTILDSLVIGQTTADGNDERVVLFVKLPDGVALSERLMKAVAQEIRSKRTPRHVPAKVRPTFHLEILGCIRSSIAQMLSVRDIPHTLNGKKVEVPVRKVRASLVRSRSDGGQCSR